MFLIYKCGLFLRFFHSFAAKCLLKLSLDDHLSVRGQFAFFFVSYFYAIFICIYEIDFTALELHLPLRFRFVEPVQLGIPYACLTFSSSQSSIPYVRISRLVKSSTFPIISWHLSFGWCWCGCLRGCRAARWANGIFNIMIL